MKILVISQHLFPMQTPRAHRTTELVRELGKQGHQVTLYAVLGKHDYSEFEDQSNVKVKNIRLKWVFHPYNSDNDKRRTWIDKILGRLFRRIEFPNLEFMFGVQNILKKDHQYDALITIADPHQIHWGAAKYRRKYPELFPKIWIADCGDPFMKNNANQGHLKYFEKYERLFCEQCDFIAVPVEEAKSGYYEEYRDKIRVIPQGFNFQLPDQPVDPNNEILTFAFAGNFYKDIRNPESFLKYLANQKMPFRFVVFTPFPDLINQYKTLLGERLQIRSALPRIEMIEELRQMDFLVNIENVNSPAQVPSKLIDYAIANRPILSVNPVKPDTTIVDEFLSKNYSKQFVVKDVEQYQISNVANRFVQLIQNPRG